MKTENHTAEVAWKLFETSLKRSSYTFVVVDDGSYLILDGADVAVTYIKEVLKSILKQFVKDICNKV